MSNKNNFFLKWRKQFNKKSESIININKSNNLILIVYKEECKIHTTLEKNIKCD